jgi:hypothetical protein
MLEVCAGLAAQQGDFAGAAQLYGAAEAQAARTGIHRDPADDAFLSPWVSKARTGLGEAAFAAGQAAGSARDFEEMLAEARARIAP